MHILSISVALLYLGVSTSAGFLSVCSSVSMSTVPPYSNLIATCPDSKGNPVNDDFDLNDCIANMHGTLVCAQGGRFFDSCKQDDGCTLAIADTSTPGLQCECSDGANFVGTNFDIDSCIRVNSDGKIFC